MSCCLRSRKLILRKVKNHDDIHTIGYVHDKANEHTLITKQRNVVVLKAQGWNHLRLGLREGKFDGKLWFLDPSTLFTVTDRG
jgi:hypothetical protein